MVFGALFFVRKTSGSYAHDICMLLRWNFDAHPMAHMRARLGARPRAHRAFKMRFFDFAHLISRGRHFHRFMRFKWLLSPVWRCERDLLNLTHIILRFHAFWIDIKNFRKNWNFKIFRKNQLFLLILANFQQKCHFAAHQPRNSENFIWLKMPQNHANLLKWGRPKPQRHVLSCSMRSWGLEGNQSNSREAYNICCQKGRKRPFFTPKTTIFG